MKINHVNKWINEDNYSESSQQQSKPFTWLDSLPPIYERAVVRKLIQQGLNMMMPCQAGSTFPFIQLPHPSCHYILQSQTEFIYYTIIQTSQEGCSEKASKKQIWTHSKPCIYGNVGGKWGGGGCEGVKAQEKWGKKKNGQMKRLLKPTDCNGLSFLT